MLRLYKDKIQIDKENLPKIESIKTLIDEIGEADATKVLIYVYLMHNRSDENPLKDFSSHERSHRAKMIAFGASSPISERFDAEQLKLITKVIKDYEESFVDKIQRDIDLYDKKMYEFIKLLDDNKPQIVKNIHETSFRVSFSTNIDILTTILDNSIDIILDKAALTHLKKTGKWSSELRGGLSPNTKGKLTV